MSTTSWKLPRTEQLYQRGTSLLGTSNQRHAIIRSTAFIVFHFAPQTPQSAQTGSQTNRNKPTFPGWISHRLGEVLGLISCNSTQLLIKKKKKVKNQKKKSIFGLCCFLFNPSLWQKQNLFRSITRLATDPQTDKATGWVCTLSPGRRGENPTDEKGWMSQSYIN